MFAGAPSRWVFDLLLNPYDNPGFQPELNPMLINCMAEDNGRYQTGQFKFYRSQKHQVNLPWLWQFPVAARGGGSRPLTDLLDNLLLLQGISTGNGSHSGSFNSHYRFHSSDPSLSALSVDGSDKKIKGITTFAGHFPFSSRFGHKPLLLQGGCDASENLIAVLIEPFSKALSENRWGPELKDAFNYTLKSIERAALQGNQNADAVLQNQEDTRRLLQTVFNGNTSEIWLAKYKKYEDLIARTIKREEKLAQLPLLSDLPIGSKDRDLAYSYGGSDVLARHDDLRQLIHAPQTYPKFMAGHFALAEFVIENDLSNLITISPGPFAHIYNEANQSKGLNSHVFDEHVIGMMPSLVINTSYHRAAGACLLEFIDFLKERKEFANTVIDFGSEFNRAPRVDRRGSDHGWKAKSTAIYSGAITGGPYIAGNMRLNSSTDYPGPWGHGAATKTREGTFIDQLSIAHLHSTLAYLLRAPTPFPATPSLVEFTNDPKKSLTLKVEKTRLV